MCQCCFLHDANLCTKSILFVKIYEKVLQCIDVYAVNFDRDANYTNYAFLERIVYKRSARVMIIVFKDWQSLC